MLIKAIALDDEPPALKVIQSFCENIDFISLDKTFTSPDEAGKYLRKFPVDLLFLDINMPSVTGIEFLKTIDQDLMVIFTTAYSEYAVEGFNLNAVDYLLKPFTPERFEQAVKKAKDYFTLQNQSPASNQALLVRSDYKLVRIDLSEIIYIEGLDDYIRIHIEGRKPVMTRMTMKAVVEKLPAVEFVRVHKSFIVSLKKIESVRNKMIKVGPHEIPIGKNYEEEFLKTFHT
jgi:DNA-binding LytR/AlgR family response regulator